MKNLDVKLGIGKSARSLKKPITEQMIKMQAIQQIEKNKAMGYNFTSDKDDLYTSYFEGPKSGESYK